MDVQKGLKCFVLFRRVSPISTSTTMALILKESPRAYKPELQGGRNS